MEKKRDRNLSHSASGIKRTRFIEDTRERLDPDLHFLKNKFRISSTLSAVYFVRIKKRKCRRELKL